MPEWVGSCSNWKQKKSSRGYVDVVVGGNIVARYRERLLEDHAVFIGWVGVAAEAEVAQAVYDVTAVVLLVSLYYVRWIDNKIGSFVNGNVPQLNLRFIGDRFLFGAPMEIDGNKLSSVFLGGLYVLS